MHFLRELLTFERTCLLSRYMAWCGKGLGVGDRKINFVFGGQHRLLSAVSDLLPC